MELRNTVSNQKLIIARMEKDINAKMMIIDCLSQQLVKEPPKMVNNLLEFD
jgi:archaellum biogenesis ATPase FlaH